MLANENMNGFGSIFKNSSLSTNSFRARPEIGAVILRMYQLEKHLNQAKKLLGCGNLSSASRQKLAEAIATGVEGLKLKQARFENKKAKLLQENAYYLGAN